MKSKIQYIKIKAAEQNCWRAASLMSAGRVFHTKAASLIDVEVLMFRREAGNRWWTAEGYNKENSMRTVVTVVPSCIYRGFILDQREDQVPSCFFPPFILLSNTDKWFNVQPSIGLIWWRSDEQRHGRLCDLNFNAPINKAISLQPLWIC